MTTNNPLLNTTGLPPFADILPEHVVPAIQHRLQQAEEMFNQLEANVKPTWAGTIEALDEMGKLFERTWGPVTHLQGVENSPELREAYESVLGDMVSFGLKVKQSQPIYAAIKELKESDLWATLDEAQHRIIDEQLLAAELAGISLKGKDRERFNEIANELSQLSTEFSNHVLDSTKAQSLKITEKNEVAGIPESALQLAAQSYNQEVEREAAEAAEEGLPELPNSPEATADDGPWRFTLDIPSFSPFMQHCQNRELRKQMYQVYTTRASLGELDNTPLINKILKLRLEKAKLLGYNNFAEVSLATKMAPNVAAVEEMFETLRAASWEPAQHEMIELQELAKESGETEELKHWDIAFWAERLREKKFDFTDEQLRPYFSLERVLDGLYSLVNRIFGITVHPADDKASLWHDDARYFTIDNEAGEQIAGFYLDPYSRPENKRGGAWMDDCLSRRKNKDGSVQLPVAYLICNSTPPVGDKPSLMTFREVETLFHEFGHGLQHMLTTVDYADVSGINGVEWDSVELASQFMENWCYHKPTLIGMTAHYETGEPLPDDLFEKICAARTFRSASNMLRQLMLGMTDITLYKQEEYGKNFDPFEIQKQVTEKTSLLPMLPGDRFLCAFQHIFPGGYCAGYYSYKWAEVLSADAFSAFEDAGLDDEQAVATTGRRFRDTVLAMGGGRHPMDVFKDFRGREPNTKALLRHTGLSK